MSPVWGRKRGTSKVEDEAAGLSVWLDVHAAAQHADVPLATLSRAIHSKQLAVTTDPVREIWLVDLTDLEAWCREVLGRPARGGGGRGDGPDPSSPSLPPG